MKNSFNSLTFFIGINVSKLTLDVTVLIATRSKKKYKRVGNSTAGMKELNSCLRKQQGFKYPITELCRYFEISLPTAYKLTDRFEKQAYIPYF